MDALQAELLLRGWDMGELAAIWRISPGAAAACLRSPEQISCQRMLLLQQAAGWNGQQAAGIFFASVS